MGLFDEVYNVVPSPYTGIVYSTLQTKSLERVMTRYNFYQKIEDVDVDCVEAYTIDSVGERFFGGGFFTVYYRVRDSMIVPEVEKVVMKEFRRLRFFDVARSDVMVYRNDEVLRALPGANYMDIGFVLSFLSEKRPVKILEDSGRVLKVSWGGDVITFEKVDFIPFFCRVCGNVKEFTIREEVLFNDVHLVCNEHGNVSGNAVFMKGRHFFGWRFFDSFAPVFLLGELYGVSIRDCFDVGGVKFTFVELPVYSLDYPVFVEVCKKGGECQLVKIEEYLHL